tara:strand:- start:635 stop:778 length:144 start_codon:yes stop_codon:yes gene_type:complete
VYFSVSSFWIDNDQLLAGIIGGPQRDAAITYDSRRAALLILDVLEIA